MLFKMAFFAPTPVPYKIHSFTARTPASLKSGGKLDSLDCLAGAQN